jgi:hypothetical protein
MQITKDMLHSIITEVHEDYLDVHTNDWGTIADRIVDDFVEPNVYWKDSHQPFHYVELFDIIMDWRKEHPRSI